MSIWVLLEQQVFLQNLFSVFGALIFILPDFHSPSQKLKKRRVFKKKKSRKKERKRRRTSFNFFQLILSLFSIKRNSKGKRSRKNRSPIFLHPPHSHFPNTKKERKEERKRRKNGRKETKSKENEDKKEVIFLFFLILSFCSHSFPKNEKDTEKIEK